MSLTLLKSPEMVEEFYSLLDMEITKALKKEMNEFVLKHAGPESTTLLTDFLK